MKPSRIEVRRLAFDVRGEAKGLWNPRKPELSHTLNAFQLALPYLEPYFIDTIREASETLTDPKLKQEAALFCEQEANHSREHMRYNRFLRQHYPELHEFEARIRESLARSKREDSLPVRLAYTAGYEAITAQLARWMFRDAHDWFDGADAQFSAMMTWHAAEEIEHRHVAYDVLQAAATQYGLRARGFFAALRKTYSDMTPVVTYMLGADGYGGRLDSKMRRLRLRLNLVSELVPTTLRYLSPGYHPSNDDEPMGFTDWMLAHSNPASAEAASVLPS
jgi:predicted metal-dependent hydrolase